MTGSPFDDVPLGPELDFLRTLWRANHALERLSAHMESRLGVTLQQRLLIRCVGKFPGLTAGQLAALLHLDPSTVSSALKRLRKRGMVRTLRDPDDARRAFVALTARGRIVDAERRETAEAAVSELLSVSPPDEIDAAKRTLSRLVLLVEGVVPT